MSGQKPRAIAVRVLHERLSGAFVEHLLETALSGTRLSSVDRHLCQELVYGIVRWQATLDWLIRRKTSARPQKPLLQDILRLGLYQLFWLDRIPDHAAVNETVQLARESGFGPQAGFVNAVLRGYLREAEATLKALEELKATEPALGYSHPEWLVQRWQERWGKENAERLLRWNNAPPKTYARVNLLKGKAEELLPQWREEGVQYDFLSRDWIEPNLVFELKAHPSLAELRSFKQGKFYIQDLSTLLSVTELQPRPGENVLDMCAAPGGKLGYMAQLMHNQGRLLAYDPLPERLELLRANAARLGLACVDIVEAKPGQPVQLPGELDRILIDAPCSNTGVMRRRIDSRWRLKPEEIARLRVTQMELLCRAAGLLKLNGTLVYSTCSIEPEENRQLVNQFLSDNLNFELLRERELLPFQDEVDGAYVARLRRRS